MRKHIKRKSPEVGDTMRPEYDFSNGVWGKHAARYAEGKNVIVLEQDVAREFRTAEHVNETLRSVLPLLQQHRRRGNPKTD